MGNKFWRLALLFLLANVVLAEYVFADVDSDNQADLRENALEIDTTAVKLGVENYPFINLGINALSLNGDNWETIKECLRNSSISNVEFVHIGDSHIQADVTTDRIRNKFQADFGNGGRGLISPFKIAGTNEPFNYCFTIDGKVVSAKLLKTPWQTDMGFTGVSFTPVALNYRIGVSTQVKRCVFGAPFDKIRIFQNGELTVDKIRDEWGYEIPFMFNSTDDITEIVFEKPQTNIYLEIHGFEPVTFFGMELIYGKTGIRYHAIGNNGATFASYNRLGSMGFDLSMLNPKLVIVSLGTNEAFGKFDSDMLEAEMKYFIRDIKKNNPGAKILLTTPMECQKAKRVPRRIKLKNGRTKTVYKSTRNYTVNENIKKVRDVIVEFAKKENIAIYDWFEISGGVGASNKWVENKLMNSDRIHLTFAGYELQGDLMYDALHKLLTK